MLIGSDTTVLGQTNFRNRNVKFGIKTDDRRRHIYIVGKTGVGKTTMMENMIVNDIMAGRGVGLLDPHGEFAEKVLRLVPEERAADVIYFDPNDTDFPVGFNPLERVAETQRHLVASGVLGVFKKIWPDVWSARMEYILSNALLTLLEYPDATLLGIVRILSDKKYRDKLVANLTDPVIKSFWLNEFSRYSERFEVEAVAAILNKVGQFVSNPLIRNIIGQTHSSINLRQVMDDGKILIANLARGRIGEENSSLLGALLVTRLQLAAMRRVDIPEEKRRDFFLYLDEFQHFSTESFANILSEARKYRLNLVLAHQYIGQLTGEMGRTYTAVKDAIFGNVGTMVVFRVGPEDAEFLEREFIPYFEENDLVNLAKYNIYVRMMIDGIASRPFSAETLPPTPLPKESFVDVIIENSRRLYAASRETVEKKIHGEWLGETELIKEKVERRGERELDILKTPPPRPEKKKKEIDREKLRRALGQNEPFNQ